MCIAELINFQITETYFQCFTLILPFKLHTGFNINNPIDNDVNISDILFFQNIRFRFQLDVAKKLGLDNKSVAPIYISIAVTCSDCKQFEEALLFYELELQLRENELKEVLYQKYNIISYRFSSILFIIKRWLDISQSAVSFNDIKVWWVLLQSHLYSK